MDRSSFSVHSSIAFRAEPAFCAPLYRSFLAALGAVGSHSLWTGADGYGRPWTAVDSEPFGSGRHGPQRTAMDGLRPSTDQKVGDSSSSGRATKALYGKGFVVRPLMHRMTFGRHSLHCDPSGRSRAS